jgi:enoyl-CoA hydratase
MAEGDRSKYVRYEKDGHIARIILDQQEKLNAWSDELSAGFHEALTDPENDDDIKVLIIKAAGRAFCAGADLTQVYKRYGGEPGARRPSERMRLRIDRRRLSEGFRRVFLFPKITICQLHGYCIGLGLHLATCCDISMAADDAQIGLTEQRLGFAGTSSVLPILIARIGLTRTIDLLLPGKLISGKEAERIGLVTRSIPPDRLEKVVETRAQEIALLPRDGIAIGKAMRQLEYGELGILSAFNAGYVGHTLFTNIRWEPDEFNFVRERNKVGVKKAFGTRDALWGGGGLRSDAIARGEVED